MKKILVLIITTLLIICGTAFAEEETNIPQLINYQGKLTDSDGNALSTKEYEMSFSIFTTQTGGTAVWGPQKFEGSNKITVARGFFNVILGPIDSTDRKIEAGFESPNAYLEITVDGKVITPRQSVLSTSYAFQAQKAKKADEAQIAVKGVSPVGSVITWTTEIVPEGYLECNGQSLSKTEYPELFAVIEYRYGGSGDNFNLPDYRSQFLRGWSHDKTVDPDPDKEKRTNRGDDTTGNFIGTKQGFALENMKGSIQGGSNLGLLSFLDGSGTGVFRRGSTKYTYSPAVAGTAGYSLEFDTSYVAQTSTETRPININVMYCIKYKKYNE
ncbi:MAG: tail fiber protein [Deltaproteobacteria bacterium]|nr:tail fiber protein [Deltaproteobacteria bacterium]